MLHFYRIRSELYLEEQEEQARQLEKVNKLYSQSIFSLSLESNRSSVASEIGITKCTSRIPNNEGTEDGGREKRRRRIPSTNDGQIC